MLSLTVGWVSTTGRSPPSSYRYSQYIYVYIELPVHSWGNMEEFFFLFFFVEAVRKEKRQHEIRWKILVHILGFTRKNKEIRTYCCTLVIWTIPRFLRCRTSTSTSTSNRKTKRGRKKRQQHEQMKYLVLRTTVAWFCHNNTRRIISGVFSKKGGPAGSKRIFVACFKKFNTALKKSCCNFSN